MSVVKYGVFQGHPLFQRNTVPGGRPKTVLSWLEDVVAMFAAPDQSDPRPLPGVTIFSPYYARIAPVTEAITNAYPSGARLEKAVEIAYQAADIVNMELAAAGGKHLLV